MDPIIIFLTRGKPLYSFPSPINPCPTELSAFSFPGEREKGGGVLCQDDMAVGVYHAPTETLRRRKGNPITIETSHSEDKSAREGLLLWVLKFSGLILTFESLRVYTTNLQVCSADREHVSVVSLVFASVLSGNSNGHQRVGVTAKLPPPPFDSLLC
ncbi:hypothetical protein DNTS_021835 [Danionella cerebrum]|uniref:Uncharacterized protein n=1 Tax=Danionella cerebrum TaxID=2873325 RepID=A0A553R2D0_9TELE|nr:hypothetical protein DNTS_021835 [Danionella translucida]